MFAQSSDKSLYVELAAGAFITWNLTVIDEIKAQNMSGDLLR